MRPRTSIAFYPREWRKLSVRWELNSIHQPLPRALRPSRSIFFPPSRCIFAALFRYSHHISLHSFTFFSLFFTRSSSLSFFAAVTYTVSYTYIFDLYARRLPSRSRLIISYSYRSAAKIGTLILRLLFHLHCMLDWTYLASLSLSLTLIANLLTSPFHPFPIPPTVR